MLFQNILCTFLGHKADKIDFHKNIFSMHRSAIKKLQNEKPILMKIMKGCNKNDKE